jgi:hypothetical protein
MDNIIAFADECGNNSFEFETQGTHFIVAAVIFNLQAIEDSRAKIEKIRKKYFQTGEIKSQKVAKNHHRRILILKEILNIEFSIYSVIVDKRKLYGEGFKFKSPFYKFLNGLVYKELFKTFKDLKLSVDEHGSNDFMRQFKEYVKSRHISTLFSNSEFDFSSSNTNEFIQLADFIAGTLNFCFDEFKKGDHSKDFLELLKPKLSSINHFPPENKSPEYIPSNIDGKYDKLIAEMGVLSANNFLLRKSPDTQVDIDQINFVKLLLLYFNYYDYKTYVSTKELIRHIQIGRNEKINEHYFRTKIVAKVRDKGVLISSTSGGNRNGYKLPSSLQDLYNFINHGKVVILPMLSRIKKFRDAIKLASNNTIDVLEKDEFKELKNLLDK